MDKENSWFLVGKDGRKHTLPHRMIFIGREECEIILQAVNADKRHAVVSYSKDEREFLIKDLNSLTGTYVNGTRIAEQTYVKLKHLDCIRFGYGPDVFYLEKTPVPRAANCVENCVVNCDTRKVESVESHDTKCAPANKTKLHRIEYQHPANRTDIPPDSLPLTFSTTSATRQSWGDADSNLSDSPDYSQRSESSSCSAPPNSCTTGNDQDASSTHSSPAAMAFTVAFENEITTPRKKLGIRDSIKKFAPTKPEFEGRNIPVSQKNSKPDLPIQKVTAIQVGQPEERPPAKVAQENTPKMKLDDHNNEKNGAKNPAAFLIKKMLKTEGPVNMFENTGKTGREMPPGDANDDRSEAGTYTVEAENNDCDVEEARKRIDEVFGVTHLSDAPTRLNKQIPCLNGQMIKQNLHKNNFPPKQRLPHGNTEIESNSLWPRGGGRNQYCRGRQLIPTISNPENAAMHSDGHHVESGSLQRPKKINEVPMTPDKSRRTKLATSPKSPGRVKQPLSTLKSPCTRTNNLSSIPVEKNTSSTEDLPPSRSSDNRSEGSNSPHAGVQWRKVPWNLSGSDAELDQSKSENNSVISDTSTEPSSHSSHSGKVKTDHGPQMRLNRAFALRRARLEADTAKRGKENKTMSGSQKAMKKSGKLSASTTTLREVSSGKTNFRLSPALANPKPFTTGKAPVKPMEPRTEPYRKKPEVKVAGHRRMDSDPGKGIPIWRNDLRPSTASGGLSSFAEVCTKPMETPSVTFAPLESERLQSFHRSMSCSVMNDTNDIHRTVPSSFLRSFNQVDMTASQIVTGPISDEYHCKKHPTKELTALDSLVISAIHQLSSKLWTNSKSLLEKEREKCRKESDCWLMIEEVLPNVPVSETPEDGDLTKDLSNILKNLKRVEQGLEVLSCVLDSENIEENAIEEKKPATLPQNFFIVDM